MTANATEPMSPPDGNMDFRMRAVETQLFGLAVEVRETRQDLRDFVTNQAIGPRRETCPHNEDFVRILAALEAGGKRFGDLERAVWGEGSTDKGLTGRVEAMEHLVLWARGAKWAIIAGATALGWLGGLLWPYLRAFFE